MSDDRPRLTEYKQCARCGLSRRVHGGSQRTAELCRDCFDVAKVLGELDVWRAAA